MNNEFATESERRNLQLEDARTLSATDDRPREGAQPSYVRSVHHLDASQLLRRLPAEMLMVENPESGRKITMVPGVLGSEHVRVGRHVAPDPVDLPAFIKRFAEGYTSPQPFEAA